MLYVIATIEVVPEHKAAFLREFKAVCEFVRKEEGCIFYLPTTDMSTGLPRQMPLRPYVVTIVEAWESLPHLQAHLVAPHMNDYRQKIQGMVVSSVLQILEPA